MISSQGFDQVLVVMVDEYDDDEDCLNNFDDDDYK